MLAWFGRLFGRKEIRSISSDLPQVDSEEHEQNLRAEQRRTRERAQVIRDLKEELQVDHLERRYNGDS